MAIGGCPISLGLDDESAYEKIFDSILKVITQDIPNSKSYENDTLIAATKIITFLALKKPGKVSFETLSNIAGKHKSTVPEILNVLERTHLIFSVKPYGGTSMVQKAWNYYFMHPSLNAAIRYIDGIYDPKYRSASGLFAENLVAANFFRMKETITGMIKPVGVFYPRNPKKGDVDFLISDIEEKILPVEVGVGKKGTKQIRKAIECYKSDYGILIADFDIISMSDNILRIPLPLFALT